MSEGNSAATTRFPVPAEGPGVYRESKYPDSL